jgi:glycosyltransferase involved in cell wall biosynthesis
MHAPANTPLVSVCMPVYNGGAFLAPAIASVLAQSHTQFELLVFDDGSTDGSWEALQQIDDPRLRAVRNARNLGPEGNWNQALDAARGPYIKLFHQDDVLAPDCLAQQVAALEAHPQAVLALCRRAIIGPRGNKLMSRGAGWKSGLVSLDKAARRCAFQGTNVLGEPSAVLLRASVVDRVGRFDATLAYLVDLDYWLRMMAHGPAWYDDRALAAFRVSPRQWSAAIGMGQGRAFGRFLDRLADGALRGHGALRCWGKLRAHANGVLRSLLYRFLRE